MADTTRLDEREGDVHWYDLPDDEAEEDWVSNEERRPEPRTRGGWLRVIAAVIR